MVRSPRIKSNRLQVALAFPNAAPATEKIIKRLRALAALYIVEVVEFLRPA
jgi:hypothetical protein